MILSRKTLLPLCAITTSFCISGTLFFLIGDAAKVITEPWYQDHKTRTPWLICNYANQRIGCRVCAEVGSMTAAHRKTGERGLRISQEWAKCEVGPYGETRCKQMSSLRKKLSVHDNSLSHQRAVEMLAAKKKNPIGQANERAESRSRATTARCFRTAYKTVKCARPLADYPNDILLQELNGCDMGRILHSNVIGKDIISHISSQMRKKVVKACLNSGNPISVLLDESTSLSKKSCLIVYVRCAVNGSPSTFFLDLVELGSGTASGIMKALLDTLHKHGFSQDFLKDKWLSIATDGCSTMLGRCNGLIVKLQETYPDLLSWHCSAHRLELAVSDALKEVTATNHFQLFMESLYSTYSMSPKNQRELDDCAAELGTQLMKIGKIFTIRWVASSERTVKAVWKSFPALYAHLTAAAKERSGRESAKFSGLADTLSSVPFVQNLALMLDCLSELSSLSLDLQRNDIDLSAAHQKLSIQRQVFVSMLQRPGRHEHMVTFESGDYSLFGVELNQSRQVTLINRLQFIQSLINSLDRRMFSTAGDSEDEKYQDLVSSSKLLDPTKWTEEEIRDITFGDNSITKMARTLRLNVDQSVKTFREFVFSGGKNTEAIHQLTTTVCTIPVSTAECERGFHSMNLLMTDLRTSLLVDTLSSLLFIYCVGPPVHLFKPASYVSTWFAQGRHSSTDVNSKEKSINDSESSHLSSLWKLL